MLYYSTGPYATLHCILLYYIIFNIYSSMGRKSDRDLGLRGVGFPCKALVPHGEKRNPYQTDDLGLSMYTWGAPARELGGAQPFTPRAQVPSQRQGPQRCVCSFFVFVSLSLSLSVSISSERVFARKKSASASSRSPVVAALSESHSPECIALQVKGTERKGGC